MKPSEVKNSISVDSYVEKNDRNFFVAEKRRISKPSNKSIRNFDKTN